MLDNLRNQTSFEPEKSTSPAVIEPARGPRRRKTFDQLTGMTASQRLILAIMLFVIVCMAGFILLTVLGSIVPPFI